MANEDKGYFINDENDEIIFIEEKDEKNVGNMPLYDFVSNQKILDSVESNIQSFQLATGLIDTTKILFKREEIIAAITSKGFIEFFDIYGKFLDSVEVPDEIGGREVYEQVKCEIENNNIIIKFPIVEWIDNYPYCDGEYDRWDTRTIDHYTVTFNLKTKKAIIT